MERHALQRRPDLRQRLALRLPPTRILPFYTQVNLGVSHDFITPASTKPLTVRFDVVNVFDSIYEIRDGSGIGVFAPQYRPRRGFFVGYRRSCEGGTRVGCVSPPPRHARACPGHDGGIWRGVLPNTDATKARPRHALTQRDDRASRFAPAVRLRGPVRPDRAAHALECALHQLSHQQPLVVDRPGIVRAALRDRLEADAAVTTARRRPAPPGGGRRPWPRSEARSSNARPTPRSRNGGSTVSGPSISAGVSPMHTGHCRTEPTSRVPIRAVNDSARCDRCLRAAGTR